MVGLAIALGTLAGVSCKPGKEKELLESLFGALTEQFAETLSRRFARRFDTDRPGAVAQLLDLLDQVANKGR